MHRRTHKYPIIKSSFFFFNLMVTLKNHYEQEILFNGLTKKCSSYRNYSTGQPNFQQYHEKVKLTWFHLLIDTRKKYIFNKKHLNQKIKRWRCFLLNNDWTESCFYSFSENILLWIIILTHVHYFYILKSWRHYFSVLPH